MPITDEQREIVLGYRKDNPEAHPPEISKATGENYRDVVRILKEYEANRPRYRIEIETEFFSYEDAMNLVEAIRAGGDKAEIKDVTPCAFRVNHGPGHQSQTYCELTGPHEIHGMTIMGLWEEFDQEGNDLNLI